MPFQLPINIVVRQLKQPRIHVVYPEISGMKNQTTQKKMNHQIASVVQSLAKFQAKTQPSAKTQILGRFEIKTNERGFFCVLLINEAVSTSPQQKYTIMKALTFDVTSGVLFQLNDLFMPDKNFVFELSKLVQNQIRQRQIPLSHSFVSIDPLHDYYLADKSIVIFFPLYELTPSMYGIPMFPLNMYELLHLAVPGGPIGKLTSEAL